MRNILATVAVAATLGMGASVASAAPVNVGGVVWDPSAGSDFRTQGIQLRETSVSAVGEELSGAGIVGEINGDNDASSFCPGCDLTFAFDGFTVEEIDGNDLRFSGGSVRFYVDDTQSWNATDPATWGQGSLWLDLVGVEHFRTGFFSGATAGTLFSSVVGSIAEPENGSTGFGLLDVVGGAAADNIVRGGGSETGMGGVADLDLVSSFNSTDEDPQDYPVQGTAQITGESIPEPGSVALLGLGLLFLGVAAYRRQGV